MEINRNNYEAYLLDLLEGRLTAEEEQKVRDFLSMHPDLSAGVEEQDLWFLEKRDIPFPGREQLKKEFPDDSSVLDDNNFDLFSIARLEGDLTPAQEQEHASLVARDEEKSRQWELWQQTHLPVTTVLYEHKKRLKKREGWNSRVIWLSVISSAAVIALLITLLKMDTGNLEQQLIVEQAVTEQGVTEQGATEQAVTDQAVTDQSITEQEIAVLSPSESPQAYSLTEEKEDQKENKKNEENEGKVMLPDTTDRSNQIIKERLEIGPIHMATLARNHVHPEDEGIYDRIKPLDLPPGSIHLTSLSLAQLAELDLQEMFDEYTQENEISLWTLANAGIKGINKITGSEISLLAARDEEGDVSGFHLKGRRFSIETPLDRSE